MYFLNLISEVSRIQNNEVSEFPSESLYEGSKDRLLQGLFQKKLVMRRMKLNQLPRVIIKIHSNWSCYKIIDLYSTNLLDRSFDICFINLSSKRKNLEWNIESDRAWHNWHSFLNFCNKPSVWSLQPITSLLKTFLKKSKLQFENRNFIEKKNQNLFCEKSLLLSLCWDWPTSLLSFIVNQWEVWSCIPEWKPPSLGRICFFSCNILIENPHYYKLCKVSNPRPSVLVLW